LWAKKFLCTLEYEANIVRSPLKTSEHSSELEHVLRVARNRIEALENELAAMNNHSDALQKKIEMFHGSLLWQLAAPLRIALKGFALSRSSAANIPVFWSISRHSRRVKSYLGSRWRVCQIRRKTDQRAAEAELKAFLDFERKLIFPRSAEPNVSIIVVLYNQAPLTFRCLRSVAREVCTPYEMIVVDNGSTDATGRVLDRLEGAEIIWNTTNLFFSRAVRQGAELANAKYILLLNNDAILQEGAVEHALETIESAEDIGAVGGRILLSEKVLQEAGSIIWRDGTCQGYGRGDDPEKPEYIFQRDVDYCSGAFLLLRRDLFRRLDYFDESFVPAYYEETDLCMRLKKVGYRTVYDPRVRIFHREFGSVNRDRAIALQEKHRVLFVDKHKQQLDRRHLPAHPDNVLWARAQPPRTRKRVLVVDAKVPDPILGAGFPRAQQMVRVLHELGHFVTLYPLLYSKDAWKDVYSVLPLKVEVMLGYGVMRLEEFLIERVNYYDKIIVSRPDNMAVLRRILKRRPDLRGTSEVIYDVEALFAMRTIKRAEVLGKPLSQQKCKKLLAKELELASFADQVVVVSENEANYYSAHGCQRLKVLGHSIEPQPTISLFHERRGFLFVGALDADISPNTDALLWFVDEILPIVRRKLGHEVQLKVIGRNEALRTRKFARPGVRLLGRVPRLKGHYDQARVFIAPTRFAAGIPHKIHEAAAHGIPVVATSILADQLGWNAGDDLMVADDPHKFAEACAKLYTDERLWYSIREKALQRIGNECSPDHFRQKLAEIVN
jgi:GT2 family glycosyltransferase